ncbi:hypothetical protein KI387_020275, partial [Taxus chinensis]
ERPSRIRMVCGRMTMVLGAFPSPLKHTSPLPKLRLNIIRRLTVTCVGWDPEGILGPPRGGHIARRETEQREHLLRHDLDRRRAARQGRVVPETVADLVEFLLETEAQEIEYEIARCRPRLNQDFFKHLQVEMGTLCFAHSRTKDMDDRLVELETLHKVLIEGIEAYDKMAEDLIGAKDRLARILASKDKKAMLLEMMEKNELDRSLLALLDENIVAAQNANQ